MGFHDEMAKFDKARLEESRLVAQAFETNSANAAKVVTEIQSTIFQALAYMQSNLPAAAGYLVLHDPGIPAREKEGWFGSAVKANPFPNPRLGGRYWNVDNHWRITGASQLVREIHGNRYKLGENTTQPDMEDAARKAGVPEGAEYALFLAGTEKHILNPSLLMVATNHGWTAGVAMGIPYWQTNDRQPYAHLLDGPSWHGTGFGITPSGKPALAEVSERQKWGDGNPFRIGMYELGAWLGYGVNQQVMKQQTA